MAALNFPDPNVTTSYTNPDTGITYEWSNGIWKAVRTAQTAPELFVDADGDNLTGNLTLGTDRIILNATNGNASFAGGIDADYIIGVSPDARRAGVNPLSDTGPFYFVGTDGNVKFKVAQSGGIAVSNVNTETDPKISLSSDGSATFAKSLDVGLGTGKVVANDGGYLYIRPETAEGVALDIYNSNNAATASVKGDGSASFADYVTSNEGFYVAQTAAPNGSSIFKSWLGASTYVDILDNGSATFGPFDAGVSTNENAVQIDGTVFISRDSNTGQVFRVRTPAGEKVSIDAGGSAEFAGAIKTTATNNAFYASAGYSGGEAAIRVENTNAGGNPYYLYCDSSDGKIAYIRTDGSATFSGGVIHGQLTAGGTGGNYFYNGEVAAYGPTANSYLWRGWNSSGGSNVLTSIITADGSATFTGANGESRVFGVKRRNNSNPSLYGFEIDGNGSTTIGSGNITLDYSGSAMFKSDAGVKIHASTANTTAVLELAGTRTLGAAATSISKIKSIPENPTANLDDTSLAFETRSQAHQMQEAMRIDSSGRLLVGTDSSIGSALLQIQGDANNSIAGASFYLRRGEPASSISNGELISYMGFADNAGGTFGVIRCDADGTAGSGNYPGRLTFHTTADGASSPTERFRITSRGELAPQNGGYFHGTNNGDIPYSNAPIVLQNTSNNTNVAVIQFKGWDGTFSGSISTRKAVTTYSTLSDYRLKENVVAIDDGIARVKQLNPSRFNFMANPETTVDGFLAHEAQAVVPECVTGTKDEVDDEGNAVMQGIDQSKLVPLLTAALQEAIAKIETLEQRLSDAGIA